jgi:hypothetical protein
MLPIFAVTAEYLASLPQHSDVILTVLFQHALVVEQSALPLLVPRQESFLLRTTQVVINIVILIGHRTDIVEIRLRVKIMGVTRLCCCEAEGFRQLA